MSALRVVRPGMLTTVQDLGRWGMQDRGVPVGGPMDELSHRRANALVGNDPDAAALEITLLGPELEAEVSVTCAVTGAVFDLTVDGQPVPMDRPFDVPAGARLRFGRRQRGARAALAVAGGIDVPVLYGSRATSLSGRMGGLEGRGLRAGDRLTIGRAARAHDSASVAAPVDLPDGGAMLRVVPGPHDERFGASALELFMTSRFTVTPESNRMGYRLSGPELRPAWHDELLSDATPIGSLQVLPSGQMILLMADRQTTGGYPRIGTVITADLPIAAQLAPGDWIAFQPRGRDDALAALRAQRGTREGEA